MATIELRTAAPEKVRQLLRQALERERRLLLDAAARTREKASDLAAKTGADLEALQAGRFPHLARIIHEGLAPSFVPARPGRARRATRALPTADGVSLSRREGARPPPLRADGIATRSTRT